METRFPFQYGIASMTALPHLFVTARVQVDGRDTTGMSSDGLPPKWFTKNPDTTFEEDLPEMIAVIRNAADIVTGENTQVSFFDLWQLLYETQTEWAAENAVPPLLANLGVSLVERAVLDSVCRGLETPFPALLHKNLLGIRLGELYSELEGTVPSDYLPAIPGKEIIARHTVGLGDPLTETDVIEPVNDGLPQSLEACVAAYGLDHFKIKICGVLDRDRERLRRLHSLLEASAGDDYFLTLDGNEQFTDMAAFREHWEGCLEDATIRDLLTRLLFVEQPLHRDHALSEEVKSGLADWPGAPPLIIDESEEEIGCLHRALELGYSGTSHKNCKGIVKGIANACLLECRRRSNPEQAYLLSGEDLANVGPVALLQDLTVMAVLGIAHVERNGHHYFKGLSMFPRDTQDSILASHGDLYRYHEDGFATLRIDRGRLSIASLLEAPFGTHPLIDASRFLPLDEWLPSG